MMRSLEIYKYNRFVALLVLVLFAGFNHTINNDDILADLLRHKDLQKELVLLNNMTGVLPVKDLTQRKIASIDFGNSQAGAFDEMLRKYAAVQSFKSGEANEKALASFNTLILQVTPQSAFSAQLISFILNVQKSKDVIIAGFGHTGALQRLEQVSAPILWNPSDDATAARESAQAIFGGVEVSGKLFQSISNRYFQGAGYTTSKIRLAYANPEQLGIDPSKLNKIDNIVDEAIRAHATPSAVVMVVKDGNVIFNRAYGSHTYSGDQPTQVTDIYDLASVTKVAATTIAAMKLYDEQKLDVSSTIGQYLPEARSTNKDNIPVRDVLLHQAGFVNLDFFGGLRPSDHSSDSSFVYSVKAADNYYLRKDYYKAVMLPKMLRSPLPTRGQYVYSDISMYMMKEIIEHQTQTPLDEYVLNEFYKPLGMQTAGFNPLKRFSKDEIVPTERDTYFRRALLQGYVQDPGASMANGVAGHAGLFASANDLAILNQMLLNGGSYGGMQYLKPETIQLFTASQSRVSRRGYGFDRSDGDGYPCSLASPETYGHTGYTGTCVWADPTEKLIYIFLSNRVYPSASTRLNSMRIRPRIQDVIYEAVHSSQPSDVLTVAK